MASKAQENDGKMLQAVIIGESFDAQFDPITRDIPKLLLPLVNTPLVDYSLYWLYCCGVKDVILYCSGNSYSDSIKLHCRTFIDRRRWNDMTVRVVASEEVGSMGDAMRDLYAKGLIVGDFLLIRGDTIFNINPRMMMEVHRANKAKDAKTIMTRMFLPQEPDVSRGINGESTPHNMSVVSTRVTTITDFGGRIYLYHRHRRGTPLRIPSYLYRILPGSLINSKLQDPSITICSADLPSLFADNFDCMTLDNLIHGLVQKDDLNNRSVYSHIVKRSYGTTVATWKDYERASMAVIQRLLFPICPEMSLTTGRRRYNHDSLTNHYWAPSSSVGYGDFDDRNSIQRQQHQIAIRVVVGVATEVAPTCSISHSVLGNHCKLGNNVNFENVFIGHNCIIEDGCSASQCFLGNNVHLKANTRLEPGCVVTAGVTLGPDVTVTRASLVATKKICDSLDEYEKDGEPELLSGTGYLFPRMPNDGTDELGDAYTTSADGQVLPVWGRSEHDYLHVAMPDLFQSSSGSEGGDSGDDVDMVDGRASGGEDSDEDLDEDELKQREFTSEVLDSLQNGIKVNKSPSNVALEINASRYAYNISVEVMQEIVFKCVLFSYDDKATGHKDAIPPWPCMKKGLVRYQEVLQRYLKTGHDFMSTFERMVCKDFRLIEFCVKLMYELSQEMEIIDGDDITKFCQHHGNNKDNPTDGFKLFWRKMRSFVNWLEDDSEEDNQPDTAPATSSDEE